jgi:hypothetical protein
MATLTPGNVAPFLAPHACPEETALPGWACRIRTRFSHFIKWPLKGRVNCAPIPERFGTRDFSRVSCRKVTCSLYSYCVPSLLISNRSLAWHVWSKRISAAIGLFCSEGFGLFCSEGY